VDRNDSFPRLYGSPAIFRPPKAVEDTARPPDPDDMPLQYDRSGSDPDADGISPRPYRYGARPVEPTVIAEDDGELQPASVGLRGLAQKFLSERGARPSPEFRKPGDPDVGSSPAGE
jgi:hypothetical protein